MAAPTALAAGPARRVAEARTTGHAITAAWLGVIAISGLSTWFAVVGTTDLAASRDLWGAISGARGRMIGPALIATIVVLMAAEQRWPAVRRPLLARAHVVDACYLAFFATAVVPVLTVVETGFALEVERHAPWLMLGRLPLVPRAAIVILTLVTIDGANWAAHVANHRYQALWRLHALHHSQEDMSVLTTFRTHPLVHATYLPALLPALILGASGGVPTAALIVYSCLVTLPHANLRWRFGPLGHVFVSPAYHRLHHASELSGKGTVNFGFVLVAWDRLAGLAAFPVGGPPVATGLANRPVPVEQEGLALHAAQAVLAQLAQPFGRRSRTDWRRG